MNIGSLSAILILAATCSISATEALRILAVFPLHGKSHFTMCERLAKGLAEKGHQIDVYSHFPLKKPIKNYKDFSLAGSLPQILNNMSYEFIMAFQSVNMQGMQENVGRPVCDLLKLPVFQQLIKNPPRDPPYDVVIVEVFVSNCYLALKRHLNIPMVGVVTSSILDWLHEPLGNPLNLAVQPGLWSGYYGSMNFWERLMNFVSHHIIVAQYKYHLGYQDEQVLEHFGSGYPSVTELTRDLDLLLVNAHHSLEGIRPFSPNIIPVAGLHIVDDGIKLPDSVRSWLDESEHGCIYISFGSMVRIETFPQPVLDALYATFRNIAPIRVLMKIAKPEELPADLPSNVLTQSWLSQIQVLGHKNVKAFVTHGGLMSTQESVAYAVPMIGIPLFGDQFLNIKLHVRKGTALKVELSEITEQTLTQAIQKIINDPSYGNNAQKLSKEFFDRPMSSMDTAAFWIEYIVRNGENSLRPPIVDMPWYQANLLDIYGFLLISIVIMYYVIKVLLKKFCRLFCTSKKDTSISKKRR